MPASHFHTKNMVTHIQAKLSLAHGGNDILKKCFLISMCKIDCSTQNFTFLKHIISKMGFTAIKYSGQGSFTMKKGTIDKLLFLLKTRHLPIASVNDPFYESLPKFDGPKNP